MNATPTPVSDARRSRDDILQTRRAELSAEHHHLTIGQQEQVAIEALAVADPELVCDILIGDKLTGASFLELARLADDEREQSAWLQLSTLQSAALKTPTMLSLGDLAGEPARDRLTALRRAVAASDGVLTRSVLFEVLRLGRGRWSRCNEEIAMARAGAARRSWQVVRLARHDELAEVVGARSSRRRPRRHRGR